MTDRELLEKAAKAAGYWSAEFNVPEGFPSNWDPLLDDGDALRLAVRLNIPVIPYDDETSTGTVGVVAKNWGTKEANARRAIVWTAAAMRENS